MIENAQQYRITKAEAERFEQALAQADEQGHDLDPRIKQAMREALESELQILKRQMEQYDRLRYRHFAVLQAATLRELPDALIRARIATGLTQKGLASRLGIAEQQIQRYEATRYASASLERIQAVADALDVTVRHEITLPNAPDEKRAQPAASVSTDGSES